MKIKPKLFLNMSPQTQDDGSLAFARNMKIDDDGNLVSDYGYKNIEAMANYNIVGHIVGLDNKIYFFCHTLVESSYVDNIVEYDENLETATPLTTTWTYSGGEIDGYVKCITEMKECLESIDLKSEGLIGLREEVQSIYENSGFPQLKKDIDETFEKAQKMKSVTIGVNLDDLLRPKNAGILSLNDKEFSSSGLMKHFVKFVNTKDELHSFLHIHALILSLLLEILFH